jgi:hypothetical protein
MEKWRVHLKIFLLLLDVGNTWERVHSEGREGDWTGEYAGERLYYY